MEDFGKLKFNSDGTIEVFLGDSPTGNSPTTVYSCSPKHAHASKPASASEPASASASKHAPVPDFLLSSGLCSCHFYRDLDKLRKEALRSKQFNIEVCLVFLSCRCDKKKMCLKCEICINISKMCFELKDVC